MKLIAVLFLFCDILAAAIALPHPENPNKSNSTMMVSGEPEIAIQGELPYQLSLQRGNSHICGASLIIVGETQLVITTGYCTAGSAPPSDFTVVAGDLRRSDTTGAEQTRQVTRLIIHEDWSKNDIALLTIDKPFDINENVSAIPLPTQGQNTTGNLLRSGWDTMSIRGTRSNVLQKVVIPVVDDATCRLNYPREFIAETMFCAGLIEGGKESCRGDSGSPLVSIEGGYLAGLVSWGYGCVSARFPGVNTEVAFFVDWIHEQVSKL